MEENIKNSQNVSEIEAWKLSDARFIKISAIICAFLRDQFRASNIDVVTFNRLVLQADPKELRRVILFKELGVIE